MSQIEDLYRKNIKSIKLRILIFGPDPKMRNRNTRLQALKQKRIQIREHLLRDGHFAAFPEDIIDPNAPPPINNAALAEVFLMKEYDVIVVLVETPGSNVEAGQISMSTSISAKSLLFICNEHTDGYAYQACQLAQQNGAILGTFSYPGDLRDCHLLTKVSEMILKIQRGKFFS